MIHRIVLTGLLVTNLFTNSYATKLREGEWNGQLQLKANVALPFRMSVVKKKTHAELQIHNASETIRLQKWTVKNDSIEVYFPDFDSFLRFNINSSRKIAGFWYNLNKGKNYKIPFDANHSHVGNKQKSTTNPRLSGRWKVTFDPTTDDSYHAVGIFQSFENRLAGTFLTETGDFRYLEGEENQQGDTSFYLSCFDGSHAFLFRGTIQNDRINGQFFSGSHFQGTWIAERSETFQLRDPDSLTYVVKTNPFQFRVKELDGSDFSFPNPRYTNKVVVIQLMGTWCPNCMDEINYLQEAYQNFHEKGLEIISIGYETPNEFAEQAAKIERLRERKKLPFHFLVGGKANKALASEQFPVLNEIISFPTTIVLNRKGEIVRIHTGFNGPGTGSHYTAFVQDMNAFLSNLLAE